MESLDSLFYTKAVKLKSINSHRDKRVIEIMDYIDSGLFKEDSLGLEDSIWKVIEVRHDRS